MEDKQEFTESQLARAIAERYNKNNWGGHTEHGYTHYETINGEQISLAVSRLKK